MKNLRLHVCRAIIVLAVFALSGNNLFAQFSVEKFGGVKTDFEIYSEEGKLPIIAQAVVSDGPIGLSDSYSTAVLGKYSLEFATTSSIAQRYKESKLMRESIYEVVLIDANDKVLLFIELSQQQMRMVSNNKDLKTYTLSLYHIPMILLEKTRKIIINGSIPM